MDAAFLQERIDKVKAQIVAYEDAIDALVVQGMQSYTLDTGQTRQTVTRFELSSLQSQLDSLMNRLATLQARQTGCNVRTVGPAF